MSDPVLIEPGPIPGACITSAGELDAMIAGALPVDPNGWVWTSATAPDVVTYTILKRWIWVDLTDPTKPVKRCWNASMSSWDLELPPDGSITGAMIADGTITLNKLSVVGGSPLMVLRINGAGTMVEFTDPQNLFDATHRLPVDHLALSAAGSYVLTSDGTTNVWSTKASFFSGVTYAINQIATAGAPDPSVLSFVGGTLNYRTVNASVADNTVAITKLVDGPANTMLGMDATGLIKSWLTGAQLYSLFQPYITSTLYKTAAASVQAVPVAGAAVTFATGQGAGVTNFGAWAICVTAENGYVAGDRILWTTFYDTSGDEVIHCSVSMSADGNLALQRPLRTGSWLGSSKDGVTYNAAFTPGNWRVGGWAYNI